MSISRGGRIGGLVLVSALALAMLPGPTAAAPIAASTIYDSMPSPVPGNLPSLGYEATSTAEFGALVSFAPSTPRLLTSATVLMSSWGCESGGGSTCDTTPGAKFSEDLTLNFYNVDGTKGVGSLIGSVTQTFQIPYRPSADNTNCSGQWFDGVSCWNGLATQVTFDLSTSGIGVPDTAIVSVAYNTTHHGYSPIGEAAACYTETGGCGYDSLNVGLVDPTATVTVGSNPYPDDGYWNTTVAEWYCDGGTSGVGTFRLDENCWTGYLPAITITASPVYVPPSFTGFFSPVYNTPYLNVVKAGSSVPVKFSLGGDYGLNIFDSGYPSSTQISCPVNHPTKNVKTTTTTASTSFLSYNAANDQYNYNWKTNKAWKGTCRRITFSITGDSTPHYLDFQFTK